MAQLPVESIVSTDSTELVAIIHSQRRALAVALARWEFVERSVPTGGRRQWSGAAHSAYWRDIDELSRNIRAVRTALSSAGSHLDSALHTVAANGG